MISLISYLGESWREREWVVLKKKMWKRIGSKGQPQQCCLWWSVSKDSFVSESCLPLFMLCTLLFSWIWQALWLVLDQWNMAEETLWLLKLMLNNSAFPSWVSWNAPHWDTPPENHLPHCEKPKRMERAPGARVDSSSWALSQHQLSTLRMSCLGLSAQLRLQTPPTPAAVRLQQDEMV